MLRSRSHRLTATFLVAAWMFGVELPLLNARHAAVSDIACGEVGWRTSTTTRVGTPVAGEGDGHCAVCHLQRRLRQTVVSGLSAVCQPGWTVADTAPVEFDIIVRNVQQSLSRGPPSA